MEKKSSKLKYLFIGFVLVIILIVAAAIFGKPILESYIKSKAESSLTENYGADVKIKNVTLEIFDQKVIVDGLEMTHPYKPTRNILNVPKTWMLFKLDKYFSDDIVYLDQAELLNVKIDSAKASGKAGWVDRKRYPKSETSSFDIKKIDLKGLKADFKDNFTKELKNTTVYKNYKEKTQKYESLIEDKYKAEYKEIESQIQNLKGLKLDKDGIQTGLATLKSIDRKYDLLKNIGNEVKSIKAEISKFDTLINDSQEQILTRFLDQHGLGNIGDMLQSNIKSMLLPKSATAEKPVVKTKAVEPAPKKAGPRDDILFYVNQILIKGENQKFAGKVSKFTNKKGEAPNLWEGLVKLSGEILPGSNTDINALGEKGKWTVGAKLNDFSLKQFDLLEEIDIDKGFLDLEVSGFLKDSASIKGLVNLKLQEISSAIFKKYGKWGDLIQKAIVSNPFKLSFNGFTPNFVKSDLTWDTKWLSSAPDLLHPLKGEARSELKAIAKTEIASLKQKLIDIPEVQNLKGELDQLKKKFRKDSTKKLLKGLFDKL